MKKLITMALSATLVGTMTLSMFDGIAGNAEEQEYYEGFLSDSSESTEATEYTEDVLSDSTEPTEEREYHEGLLPDPPEADDFYTIVTDENFPTTYASLPSKVDLSTSPCFPDITDQGDLGSCSAVAIAHYQYSYEVNKLNGITSKSDRVIYSPKWVYNLAANAQEGLPVMSAYRILENYGCLKSSDYPYTGISGDYFEWPSGLDTQKIEALHTRVVNAYRYEMPSNVQITCPEDSDLNTLKQLLNSGKVLVASSNNRWIAGVQNGESIAYRCYAAQGSANGGGSGHTLTIVGYDDNKSYDVNGNGTIEPCEKGAFKLANSWGTDFNAKVMGIQSDTGYFWVMYDALNPVSANTVKNWESIYPRNRMPAFSYGNYIKNAFYYIDVAHKDVNFVGKLGINTSDRGNLTLKIKSTHNSEWADYDSKELFPFSAERRTTPQRFNGNMYFDYDEFASPIKDHCKYYYWFAHLAGISSGDSFSFAILDNLGNIIKSNKSFEKNISIASCGHYISIEKGDVNYDGKIDSNDENIVNNYNLRIINFSNVQNYIGDFNNDGKVTGADTVALRRYILANGG